MAQVTKPNTLVDGGIVNAAEHNSNYDTIYNEFNGNVDNDNIKSAAAIADTKLATITTAGKVSGSALAGTFNISGTNVITNSGNNIVLTLNNSGTNHGLYITQDGVLADGKYGLYIYTNAVQNANELVYINQDNASSDQIVTYIKNDGIGGAVYINQAGNLAEGNFALYVDNDGEPAGGTATAIRFDGCSVGTGSSNVTLGNIGPATLGTSTCQQWLKINLSGTNYHIPCWK